MCKVCEPFGDEVDIESPERLRQILASLRKAVANKEVVYNSFESDRALIGQPSFMDLDDNGPWPDVILYYFDCRSCTAVFELSIEIYHGSGGHWKRLR